MSGPNPKRESIVLGLAVGALTEFYQGRSVCRYADCLQISGGKIEGVVVKGSQASVRYFVQAASSRKLEDRSLVGEQRPLRVNVGEAPIQGCVCGGAGKQSVQNHDFTPHPFLACRRDLYQLLSPAPAGWPCCMSPTCPNIDLTRL